ncbi:MAG TPA: SusC/RagA family TonB-linked outer membrane protein, partial [Flavobacteriaceae bacterium]|nr:SusC/RagA family TonB-linked outer membrane protein [Flavobacteriaceae bacterium]
MNLKTKLSLIFLLFSSIIIVAQDNYLLEGKVVSTTDQLGIPGANVVVQGTTNGTATDFDGNFQIEVKSGDVLEVTYLGYVTQTVAITNQRTLSIALVEDANTLNEVVVVGYGTRKKTQITGAVAKVGGAEIAAIQANRVDDA